MGSSIVFYSTGRCTVCRPKGAVLSFLCETQTVSLPPFAATSPGRSNGRIGSRRCAKMESARGSGDAHSPSLAVNVEQVPVSPGLVTQRSQAEREKLRLVADQMKAFIRRDTERKINQP